MFKKIKTFLTPVDKADLECIKQIEKELNIELKKFEETELWNTPLPPLRGRAVQFSVSYDE
jgi:hypothetical protein